MKQVETFAPEYVSAAEPEANRRLREALSGRDITVGPPGEEGLRIAAAWPGADCVVTAVSGAIGLRPTLDAIETGRRIALANKETLVCAGGIVMRAARGARRGDSARGQRAQRDIPVPDGQEGRA